MAEDLPRRDFAVFRCLGVALVLEKKEDGSRGQWRPAVTATRWWHTVAMVALGRAEYVEVGALRVPEWCADTKYESKPSLGCHATPNNRTGARRAHALRTCVLGGFRFF